MGHLRAALIFAGFIVAVAIAMPVQAVLLALWRSGARRFPQLFYKFHCWLAGITVVQKGAPHAPAKGEPGALLVANHVSYFDASAMGSCGNMGFIAKAEVAGWPIFGAMAKLGNCVFINRNIRSGAGRDAMLIQGQLETGTNLALFPEGTSWDGVKILPFKSALFGAAEAKDGTEYLVQPVSQTYRRIWGLPMDRRTRPHFAWYGDMDFIPHKWMAYATGPFEVVERFHAPVRPSEFGSRREMAAWCEEVIRRGVLHDRDARPGNPELPPKKVPKADFAEQSIAAE